MKALALSLFLLIGILSLKAQNSLSKLLPSEALILMINAVDMHPELKRIDATLPYLSRIITTGLSREEQFYLGEVYFWNFMPTEGIEVYSKLLDNKSDIARASWQRAMQINFLAFQKYDKVEQDLKKFRKKFDPDPKDLIYMYGQVYNLSNKYAKEGNHKKVLELINQELKALDFNGAYKSLQLPAFFFNSYKALGKESEAFSLLEKSKKGLEQTLSIRKMNIPEKDTDYLIHTSRVKGMETIVTNKLGYLQMNKKFEELINSIEKAVKYFKSK